ncbi:ABC transporter permease [Ornithobacterium rhinotracheale]|uniref:ABC transporter permease n=1 Tax=Ornithobacterium rhinotracheale TaxID=28251 RepID=UPI00129C9980|nr:ABC transporter permease [Ornithobacterium rhinotracheale]MRJ08196.1 ABC transporter permease [Ornithobacterium rhinotracheale]UOH77394.1 ABC transporter permease [Ornithobacterium rhinotracheale]
MSNHGKSVFYHSIQKLKKNVLAIVALVVIVLAAIASVFCYVLATDYTKDAALQQVVLKYKPIGYKQLMLKVPLSNYTPGRTFSDYFFGKKQDFEEIPITQYQIQRDKIIYTPYIGDGLQAEPKEKDIKIWTDKNISPAQLSQNFVYTKKFYLGTDSFGRDFYSRLLVGTRISFFIGFIAVAISLLVGIVLGAIGGYYGGKTDAAIMWLINVVWSIPTLLLVMAITLAIGKGFWQIFIAVGLTMWVEVARVVRGQFLSFRKKEFVEAAQSLGMSNARIMFKEILPNVVAPVIVISAANFAAAILVESGLSFLGIGAQPPTPSWGNIIKENYTHILLGMQHLALLPGLCILLLVLAFNVFGNALRDALDIKN